MGEIDRPDTISVFISNDPKGHVTTAEFTWSIEQPKETYTVDIEDSVSVEFGKNFPVRPMGVNWVDEGIGSETVLDRLFGKEFTKGMQLAREVGFISMQLVLSEENRAELAELQFHSPSTPTLLKEACAKKLGEYRAHQDESGTAA